MADGVCCVLSGLFVASLAGRLGEPGNVVMECWAKLHIALGNEPLPRIISSLMNASVTSGFIVDNDYLRISCVSRNEPRVFRVEDGVTSLDVTCIAVRCAKPCSPRSNMNLAHHVWQHYSFSFYKYACLFIP